MRTTLTLDRDVADALKDAAHQTGASFKTTVNETLRAGLAALRHDPEPEPYVLEPSSLGPVVAEVDLDKALRLADALEDREIARKLDLRK